LLIDLLGKLDVRAIRTAAEHVFTQRAIHNFPPLIHIPAEWKAELEVLAKSLATRQPRRQRSRNDSAHLLTQWRRLGEWLALIRAP
jgi:hypothetical protein